MRTNSLDAILDTIWSKLESALLERQSPFRIMSLATSDQAGTVSQRSVVLRALERDDSIAFYTDQRSAKLRYIDQNDQVSLLFYDSNNQVQVTCQGVAQVKNVDTADLSNFSLRSRKDYTTTLAPGTSVGDPEDVSYDSDKVHFAKVTVVLSKIDYLKLDRERHIRASFKRIDNDWVGDYLVP